MLSAALLTELAGCQKRMKNVKGAKRTFVCLPGRPPSAAASRPMFRQPRAVCQALSYPEEP